VAPAAGVRAYGRGPLAENLGLGSLHSSYAFYELTLFGDQAIAGGLRLRALASGRWEPHVDATQNAGSLYFSLDLRRLF